MGQYVIPRKIYGRDSNPLSNFGGGVLLRTDRQVPIMHSFHIRHIQKA
jgi:hypothetical protein